MESIGYVIDKFINCPDEIPNNWYSFMLNRTTDPVGESMDEIKAALDAGALFMVADKRDNRVIAEISDIIRIDELYIGGFVELFNLPDLHYALLKK